MIFEAHEPNRIEVVGGFNMFEYGPDAIRQIAHGQLWPLVSLAPHRRARVGWLGCLVLWHAMAGLSALPKISLT